MDLVFLNENKYDRIKNFIYKNDMKGLSLLQAMLKKENIATIKIHEDKKEVSIILNLADFSEELINKVLDKIKTH